MGVWANGRTWLDESMDFQAGRDGLKSVSGTFDVGVELTDVILQSFDPMLLLGEMLMTFLLTAVDELGNLVSQPFILHITDVGEGGADGSDDGGGERSRM